MDAEEFTRHYGRVRRRVECFYPRASASDVMQEAFAEALTYSRKTSRPIDDHLALFWRVAARVAQRPGFSNIDDRPAARGAPDPTEPWVAAAAMEERQLLEGALTRLESQHLIALKGYYFDGKRCNELARESGVAVSAIKSRLYRARRELERYLPKEDDA